MKLRLGSLAGLVSLLVLAGGLAHAAEPRQAAFRVTLTASLTKTWTFSNVELEASCTENTHGVGRWEAKLATKSPARIRAVDVRGGKVRFAGTIAGLAGAATNSGTMTVTAEGPSPCERLSRSERCGPRRRAFKGAFTALENPRKGIARLTRLRGVDAVRSPRSDCPAVPADIRAIRTDLPLASAPLDSADVFDRNVDQFFTRGDTEQVTTLDGEVEGRVTERVRWTLLFTRVSR